MSVRERIAQFGDKQRLVGIVTEPATPSADRPAFLILNAGIVHRVGPNRLHVRLARELAAAGFTVLRFDLSGLGDSAPRDDGLPYHQSRIGDACDAMDFLSETRGIERFVACGLCSGADHAFRLAWHDPRVIGAAMIDGYAYPSAAYRRTQRTQRLRQLAGRLLHPPAWRRIVTGQHPAMKAFARRLGIGAAGVGPTAPVERFVIDLPPQTVATEQTQTLAQRGTRLLFIYTAQLSKMYQQSADARDAFPPRGVGAAVAVTCLTGADHTFTLRSHQRRLFDALLEWAQAQWPATARHAAS